MITIFRYEGVDLEITSNQTWPVIPSKQNPYALGETVGGRPVVGLKRIDTAKIFTVKYAALKRSEYDDLYSFFNSMTRWSLNVFSWRDPENMWYNVRYWSEIWKFTEIGYRYVSGEFLLREEK